MRLTLLVLLLSGCLLPTGLPEAATPFAPPAIYGAWWTATCDCAGVRAPINRIGWSVMPDDLDGTFLCSRARLGSGYCYGAWIAPHLILLAPGQTTNEVTVRHEMLHDLLQVVPHTDPRFITCTLN